MKQETQNQIKQMPIEKTNELVQEFFKKFNHEKITNFRSCKKRQSNAIQFTNNSWLYFKNNTQYFRIKNDIKDIIYLIDNNNYILCYLIK